MHNDLRTRPSSEDSEPPVRSLTAAQAARLAAEAAFAHPTQAWGLAGTPVVVRRKRRVAVMPEALVDPEQAMQSRASVEVPRVFRLAAPDLTPATDSGSAKTDTRTEPLLRPEGLMSESAKALTVAPSSHAQPRLRRRRSAAHRKPGPVLRQVFASDAVAERPEPELRLQHLKDRLTSIGRILDEAGRAAAFELEDTDLQLQWTRLTKAADRLLQAMR